MTAQTPPTRSQTLAALTATPLDVLVVGGGIVGAGIARDAALRGLRAGLVEQHDFAFGTSSRSSRLLHGGLRYLAQGRIGLVHEASVEKRILHRIAPHLAAPLAFVFPTYRCLPWGPWALWRLRIGVKLYDLLCGGRNLGRSCGLSRDAVRPLRPGLQPDGLTGAVRYYDGLTNAARLGLDTLRSAGAGGAMVLNYCALESAERASGRWTCHLIDHETAATHTVIARTVVNATGPWAARLPHSGVHLRLTKGVHLVVDHARLPVPDAVVLTAGSRILFAIPWGRCTILGTTDTDYTGPLDDIRTDPADVRYILDIVNGAFPATALAERDLISTWAGVRPLIADPGGGPSDISRAHEIRSPEPGWWDGAGGKLTTYRLMAEQTVDRLMSELGRPRTRSATATTPLLAAADTAYSSLVPPPVTRAAVEHYCSQEWAIHLDDVLLRRAGWHYDHAEPGSLAAEVVTWMGAALHWDAARQTEELQRYHLRTASTAVAPAARCTTPDAPSIAGAAAS